MSEMFMGLPMKECGEHHSVGNRAWCHTCTSWCGPEYPCLGCEVPTLRAENESLTKQLEELWQTYQEELAKRALKEEK